MSTPTIAGVVPTWSLADRLRKARETRGLNQTELGELTGISRRAITRYECGETSPRRPHVIAWAMATGVSLAWLEEPECAVRDSNPEPADVCFAPVHVLHGSRFSPSSEALDDLATSA
jgi:transcriptional regulator with XRE-family HTH domain